MSTVKRSFMLCYAKVIGFETPALNNSVLFCYLHNSVSFDGMNELNELGSFVQLSESFDRNVY